MSTGPIAKVDTTVAAINLDVSRQLNWGPGLIMEFIVVDRNQPSGWKIVTSRVKGFDRVTDKERTRGDGSDIIFDVADTSGTLIKVLRLKGLFVRVDGSIYQIASVPPVPPNVAQVFVLHCKTRTTKTTFTANTK